MSQEKAKEFFKSLSHPVLASCNWWDWGLKGTPFLDVSIKRRRIFLKITICYVKLAGSLKIIGSGMKKIKHWNMIEYVKQ